MANGHVRPGQSVTWRNETGAPVRSGALVPFGGGIAAKALQDIPAGQEGVVTLFQVHRFPLPDGLSFSPGDMVYADGGEIAASGDVLGRFLRLDEGGWAEVLIMPLNEGGGGGGTTNYNALSNKPRINGVTLSGDKSADDLGISSYDDTALKNRVGAVETAVAAIDAQKLDSLADIKTVGDGLNLDAEGTLTATGPGGGNSFLITKGETTYDEILTAFNAGKELWFRDPVNPQNVQYGVRPVISCSRGKAGIRLITWKGRWESETCIVAFNNTWIESQFIQFADQSDLGDLTTLETTAKSSAVAAINEVATALAAKQDTLVSGTNIKTINGQSLLGSGDMVISGGGDAVLSADLTASKAVGGIASGKQYAANTPLETLFRDMLNPVENPTFTAPSATLSASGGTLVEEGETAQKTLTVNFNRGKITPAYGTSGNRSGVATGYSLNGGASQSGNTFSVAVNEGNKTFSARVDYAAGEQPKNSAGENYDSPLPAGYVTTNTLTFEIVAALWSNAANIATVAKETLISRSVKEKRFDFPAQTAANPEIFDVPATWTVTAVELLNTLNNQWVDDTSEFDVSDVTHGTVAYKRYTYNGGDATGARSIRIKWN